MAVTVSSDSTVSGLARSRSMAARTLRFLAHRPVLAVGSGVLLLFVMGLGLRAILVRSRSTT